MHDRLSWLSISFENFSFIGRLISPMQPASFEV